jgi:hypothetical protein
LIGTIVSIVSSDVLSFLILISKHFDTFFILLDIAEVFVSVDKDLPPARVSTPELHFVCLSRALDIE